MVALPAGVISISTPTPVLLVLLLGLGRELGVLAGALVAGVAAAEHRPRAGVLADEPQAPATAREQLLGDLLEVARGGLEGLLERLADAPVGVADQALELAHRGLEVLALGLQLLDVGDRLLVLALGERVDRAELLAAAAQALDPRLEVGARDVVQLLLGRRGLEPELLGQPAQLAPGVGRAVARLLRAHLAARDLLAALLQPALDLRLLRRRTPAARPPAARRPRGRRAARPRRASMPRARPPRRPLSSTVGEPLGGGPQRLVARQPVALAGDPLLALGALALGALGEPPLGAERRLELRAPLGGGTLVGRRLPLLDHPAGVALGLGRLVARARRGARGTLGVVARRVGGLDGARGLLDLRQRGLLGLRRALDLGDEPVAAVALGEHAVLAAGRDLPQLARDRRPHAPVARDRDAGERRDRARRASRRPRRRRAARRRAGRRRRRARARRAARRRAPGRAPAAPGARGASGTISAAPPSRPARSSSRAPSPRSAATAARRRGPSAAASASS